MDDLISRQAAIDTLESGKDKTAKGNIGGFYNAIIQNDIDKLRNLPSAQPERIRGYWKPYTMSEVTGYDPRLSMMGDPVFCYCCSACGRDACLGEDGQELLTDFCPYCGADMREQEGEE